MSDDSASGGWQFSKRMADAVTRRRFLGGTAGALGAGLAGCTGQEDASSTGDSESETTATAAQTASADETETQDASEQQSATSATIALSMDPTMDVWNVYGGVMPYYTNVLEPLVWVGDDMQLQPWLAESWEATGEKTWEFTLREGVKFHNGDTLTADAVVFSFREILNEWSYGPGWLHVKPENVTRIDDLTVEFETTDPFPAFPGTIAHNMVAVQHPDRSREDQKVIGTGAFRAVEQKEGQSVTVEAFDDYWNGAPKPDQLTFRTISDPNTRALSLESGEVDVAFDPPTNKLQSFEQSDDLTVETKLDPSATFVGCNLYRSPTDDVKLRRALNYAVDQSVIVESILNGIGKPAKGPIAESIYWSAHEKLPEYGPNKQKAKKLVEASSYDGETLTLALDNQDPTDGKLIAQVLQQVFAEIGVDVKIRVFEPQTYDDVRRGGEAHLLLRSMGTNSGAADYIIYEALHSEGSENEQQYVDEGTGVLNLGGEVDELIETGFQTDDRNEKESAYEEALQIVMDEAVFVPINYSEYIVGMAADVGGVDLRTIPQMSRWTGLTNRE